MIKGVIFDFDGLLVDSEYIAYLSHADFLRQFGIELTLDDYGKHVSGLQLVSTLHNYQNKYGIDFSIEEGGRFYHERETYYMQDGVKLKKGVKELLAYLKAHHYLICLATSSLARRAVPILKEHMIFDYFNGFVFKEDVERGKPHPDVFLKACEVLDIETDEAIVLEDSEQGIEAAYRAKCHPICIPDMKYPDEAHQAMTDAVLDDLTYVIDYLNENNH